MTVCFSKSYLLIFLRKHVVFDGHTVYKPNVCFIFEFSFPCLDVRHPVYITFVQNQQTEIKNQPVSKIEIEYFTNTLYITVKLIYIFLIFYFFQSSRYLDESTLLVAGPKRLPTTLSYYYMIICSSKALKI